MTLADEYVVRIETIDQMSPDELARFCRWIAVNGADCFSQRAAAFCDGSRAVRLSYGGAWSTQTRSEA